MENIADALKIVLGIMIFIVGLAVFFNMASQARETAKILISEIDRDKYYNYYDVSYTPESLDSNGNRIVKIQDIIPAIYRYSQENYGITVVNKSGDIVARFDLDTEIACNNWTVMSDNSKYKFINSTNKIFENVNLLAGAKKIKTVKVTTSSLNPSEDGSIKITNDGMEDLFKSIYKQTTSSTIRREYYCSWIGSSGWTAQRIDSDISRYTCIIFFYK